MREGNSLAMTLSPLDPFRYAMLGTQTMSFINDENFETAAEWGLRAAQAPGAHYLMGMVAAMSLELSNLSFAACGNTHSAMSQREGAEVALVSEAEMVPSGVVELIELQKEGWAYVRP